MKSHVSVKLTLFLIGFFLFAGRSFSQERIPAESITSEWTFFKEVKGVKFYLKEEKATVYEGKEPFTFVLVKLENTNNKPVKLLYNLAAHYNEGCNNCNNAQEARKPVEVPANQTVEGRYDSGNCPTSIMVYNPNNKFTSWKLTSIAIENLIIN
ncbi:hypothetical protein [Fluviicola sp.]|uniref:hypothetical protein n=1 Tax=Fluviicola sp. TaxID=1917219 RepID=UPI0031D8E0F5